MFPNPLDMFSVLFWRLKMLLAVGSLSQFHVSLIAWTDPFIHSSTSSCKPIRGNHVIVVATSWPHSHLVPALDPPKHFWAFFMVSLVAFSPSLWLLLPIKHTVNVNKRKPALELESGRPVEGALMPCHSSSITPNRKRSFTDPKGEVQPLYYPSWRREDFLPGQQQEIENRK